MVSTIGLVFQLLMAFFIINNLKLVAKNICYVVHISSPTHSCMHAVHTNPAHTYLLTCTPVIIIWQAQNGDPTRACRYSKTPDKHVFSMIHMAWHGDTQASAWSRALYASHCLV